MNTVAIVGELTFDVKKMMKETMSINNHNIKKIQTEYPKVEPSTFDWSTVVVYETWFACVNSTTNKVYYFPIAESENRYNNYSRVKNGMAYFISQGWMAYQIQ